jgi:hypothetical protein
MFELRMQPERGEGDGAAVGVDRLPRDIRGDDRGFNGEWRMRMA